METKITATELSKNLSDILNRVRYQQESFTVVRNGETVATLGPAPKPPITFREFVALLKELPRPDEDFADDLEAIQASQTKTEPPPWD